MIRYIHFENPCFWFIDTIQMNSTCRRMQTPWQPMQNCKAYRVQWHNHQRFINVTNFLSLFFFTFFFCKVQFRIVFHTNFASYHSSIWCACNITSSYICCLSITLQFTSFKYYNYLIYSLRAYMLSFHSLYLSLQLSSSAFDSRAFTRRNNTISKRLSNY